MTINSASIERALADSQQITFRLLLQDGNPCKQIGVEELKMLAVNHHVCARWRGGKILSAQLIVSADEAFGRLGQTVQRIRETLHASAASQTTQRAHEHLPQHIKKHHAQHCSSWPTFTLKNYAGRIDARAV